MTFEEFDKKVGLTIFPGMIFDNPGGGTSTIVSIQDGKISYKRQSSTMTITIKALYDAFSTFSNSTISSSDLRAKWPSIFDSNARPAGHSCNTTFLFLCFRQMGIVSEIKGRGVRGNSYYIDLRLK